MMILLALAGLGLAAVNLIMTMVLKQFTDYATGVSELALHIIVYTAIAVLIMEGIFRIVISYISKVVYSRIERKIRLTTLNKIQKSELLSIRNMHSGEIMTRLTKDIEGISQCLPTLINTIFSGLLLAIAALIYMFFLSWKISLAMIIAIPLLLVVTSIFSPKLQKKNTVDKQNEDINRNYMQDTLHSIPLIQTYRAQEFIQEKLRSAYGAKYKSAKSLGLIEGIFNFINNAMGTTMFLITMGFGAYLTVRGEFTVGSMIALINLLNYIVWPFSNISSAIGSVNQAIVSAKRIGELWDMPDYVEQPVTQSASAQKDIRIQELSVRNVSFSYENIPVLKDTSIAFQSGKIAGIIGRSGSGKTTFLHLLLGLYQPNKGSVEVAGLAQRQRVSYQGVDMSRFISYVPSENQILSGTIQENILMGSPLDAHRLQDSLRKANIEAFINEVEHGLEEKIGEGGQAVSSGQAQRIAIARALYKDADVMVFDEPTSNLDQESIMQFREVLRKISDDKIVIIVTHEMDTANACDAIYQLDKGKLRPLTQLESAAVLGDVEEEARVE